MPGFLAAPIEAGWVDYVQLRDEVSLWELCRMNDRLLVNSVNRKRAHDKAVQKQKEAAQKAQQKGRRR